MTLILGIATKGPLVFASDRRVTLPDGTYDDRINKLVMIGDAAVASAYGAVRLQGEGSSVVRFDVYEIMKDFFSDGVYNPQRLSEFERHIAEKFVEYREHYFSGAIFRCRFQVIIYSWTNGGFRLNHRVFMVDAEGNLRPKGTNKKCLHGGILADGDVAVLTELISGHNPVFDELRNDNEIKRFVINRQQQEIETVEPDEAIAFNKRLIALCNEYYPLINAEQAPISESCNLALLHRGNGVEILI
ncbi:hypothetical protein [Gimesia chilikensis]|uniref:hypothetical protein n=1 Tax=Gimesia chilikensis TaxID=2605989 RepID=UPI003A90FF87